MDIEYRADGVDPAHAGMILFFWILAACWSSGPRACGDDPDAFTLGYFVGEWTPRMRG